LIISDENSKELVDEGKNDLLTDSEENDIVIPE